MQSYLEKDRSRREFISGAFAVLAGCSSIGKDGGNEDVKTYNERIDNCRIFETYEKGGSFALEGYSFEITNASSGRIEIEYEWPDRDDDTVFRGEPEPLLLEKGEIEKVDESVVIYYIDHTKEHVGEEVEEGEHLLCIGNSDEFPYA